jgi:hypothetical protein
MALSTMVSKIEFKQSLEQEAIAILRHIGRDIAADQTCLLYNITRRHAVA